MIEVENETDIFHHLASLVEAVESHYSIERDLAKKMISKVWKQVIKSDWLKD